MWTGEIPTGDKSMSETALPTQITDPVILIRISKLFRADMTADELYDGTRSCWKVGKRREGAEYAIALHRGVVKEVYEIEKWHRGGATQCKSNIHKNPSYEGRWEFTGRIADHPVRSKYCGRSVAHEFPRGS